MKTLFFHKNLNSGGAERAVIEVLTSLRSAGLDVALTVGSEVGGYMPDVDKTLLFRPKRKKRSFIRRLRRKLSRQTEEDVEFNRVRVFCRETFGSSVWERLESRLTTMIRSDALKRLIESLLQLKPDVVVTSLIEAGHTYMMLAIATGRIRRDAFRWVTVEQNSTLIRFQDYYGAEEKGAWESITRWVYTNCDRVIAVSCGVRDGLTLNYGIPHGSIDVVYNPVSIDKVRSATELTELPTKSNRPFLLTAGRLHSQKQQHHLLRAYAAIAPEIREDLCIAGDGALKNDLINCAKELGISDRVHFLGVRTDLWSLMKSAKAFVLSSAYEGLPLVLIEAAAAGCPLIAYDCSFGPAEIIENGVNGWLVPANEEESLSAAMRNTCEETEVAAQMALRAEAILPRFSTPAIAELYRETIVEAYRLPPNPIGRNN